MGESKIMSKGLEIFAIGGILAYLWFLIAILYGIIASLVWFFSCCGIMVLGGIIEWLEN